MIQDHVTIQTGTQVLTSRVSYFLKYSPGLELNPGLNLTIQIKKFSLLSLALNPGDYGPWN